MPEDIPGKLYYKVVRRDTGGRLWSSAARGIYLIEYFQGGWVEGRQPPLFCFEGLQVARWFLKKYQVLYACEIQEMLPVPWFLPDIDSANWESAVQYWRQDMMAMFASWDSKLGVDAMTVPSTTICCKRIKLLYQVT